MDVVLHVRHRMGQRAPVERVTGFFADVGPHLGEDVTRGRPLTALAQLHAPTDADHRRVRFAHAFLAAGRSGRRLVEEGERYRDRSVTLRMSETHGTIPVMKPDSEDRVVVDVLGMEYSALRADIVHRSSVRFSMLPVGLGVFALFAALVEVSKSIPDWLLWSILGLYLLISLASWWNAGRSIGRLSNRLVELESEINRLMGSKEPLLRWEADEQRRRGPIAKSPSENAWQHKTRLVAPDVNGSVRNTTHAEPQLALGA